MFKRLKSIPYTESCGVQVWDSTLCKPSGTAFNYPPSLYTLFINRVSDIGLIQSILFLVCTNMDENTHRWYNAFLFFFFIIFTVGGLSQLENVGKSIR